MYSFTLILYMSFTTWKSASPWIHLKISFPIQHRHFFKRQTGTKKQNNVLLFGTCIINFL